MKKALFFPLKVSLFTVGYLSASSNITQAQVTTDGTVNTQVNQDGNSAVITGGETRGGNLFHSFQDFSVPTGNEAFFNNADSISNIFSRVTGGNISNIDGAIRANGSASLFLINPAGIIFGENARLDIGGSFYGSTASSILFEDGEFSAADLNTPPVLTINAPIGLGFRDEPGDIINRSTFNNAGIAVNEGQNISLVGGNVNIGNGGIVFAPGGRIELGGLLEAGTINIAEDNSLTFPDEITRGDVSLTNSSIVAVFSGGDGSIGVNAANLEIISGSRFLGGIRAETGSPNAQAGNIVINATDSVLIDGQGDSNTGIFASVRTNSIGNAGDLNIASNSFIFRDAVIRFDSNGQGNAGNILINTNGTILLDNANIASNVLDSASNNPNSGDITINANSLSLNNSALFTDNSVLGTGGDVVINTTNLVSLTNNSGISISAAGGGSLIFNTKNFELSAGSNIFGGIADENLMVEAQAGNIVINASEDVLLNGANGKTITTISNSSAGTGNAGNIEINARNISFLNGSSVASFSNGIGNGGNIILTATENILFDGIFQLQTEERLISQIGGIGNSVVILNENTINTNQRGIPGTINITATNLTLTNGAAIQSFVNGDTNSGDLNIDVSESITIDQSVETINQDGTIGSSSPGIQSTVTREGSGDSGDINLQTRNLSITNGGSIATDNLGIGNAGDINITADDINIDGQGVFTEFTDNNDTTFRSASSSNISSQSLSTIDLFPDGIVSEGNGGNINLNTRSLSITGGGFISVDNSGVGNGGDIVINSKSILLDGMGTNFSNDESINIDSSISSDVLENATGNSGTVEIKTFNLSVQNGAGISASTFGEGNAGNLTINASDSISLIGIESLITSNVNETANGNSGEVNIETGQLLIQDGAQLLTDTFGEGNAGNLTIDASDSIQLSGNRSFISSSVNEQATGNSGTLNITTGQLSIFDNGSITVESLGTGESGNLTINANSISLDNNAKINATTPIGNGGSITLNVSDDIILQNNSIISAQALNNANGGNLSVDTRFIIAFPNGNNDILASAEQGEGGNITINAESLFGIQERTPSNSTNDINASSEVSGLDGTVNIATPDINPVQGTTELPNNIVVPEETAQQACEANRESAAKNGLNIAGKGGITPDPGNPLNSLNTYIGGESTSAQAIPAPIETAQGKIQPARGVTVTESGEVILTAYRTNNSGDRISEGSRNCDRV